MPKRGSVKASSAVMIAFRLFVVAVFMSSFLAFLNPARVSGLIRANTSLFSCATSYTAIGGNFVRALSQGWVNQSALTVTYIGALVTGLAVAGLAAAACISIGNLKLRRLGTVITAGAAVLGIVGTTVLRIAYGMMEASPRAERIEPILPLGIGVYYALFAFALVFAVVLWFLLPKPAENARYEMESKYRLFLMILPFLVLVFLFSYLPLWGLRYAFYDYKAGFELSAENFVGIKWFRILFTNAARRADIVRVLRNTLAMSGIGIATSWLPMMFAIFLSEIRLPKFRRRVQTLTTIPNFISWVLVYSVAFAIFSTEGFVNWMLAGMGFIEAGEGANHLISNSYIWLKMWLWGTWKGLGWGAIIYIAGISSIDQELYEAATVDGAGRFRRMWNITVPGLMPTFFVLLLLSISNILSNGLDQYLTFQNHNNKSVIEVLDLYIYNLGLASSSGTSMPLATVFGMFKSVISVTLLFVANKASKMLRGESIV